jgi:hypothetical protein
LREAFVISEFKYDPAGALTGLVLPTAPVHVERCLPSFSKMQRYSSTHEDVLYVVAGYIPK